MIDTRLRAQMFAEVEEHVHQGQTHLARRPESPGVIAVAPNGAVAPAGAIDGTSATHHQALQATDHDLRPVSLDNEVNVIDLH